LAKAEKGKKGKMNEQVTALLELLKQSQIQVTQLVSIVEKANEKLAESLKLVQDTKNLYEGIIHMAGYHWVMNTPETMCVLKEFAGCHGIIERKTK